MEAKKEEIVGNVEFVLQKKMLKPNNTEDGSKTKHIAKEK